MAFRHVATPSKTCRKLRFREMPETQNSTSGGLTLQTISPRLRSRPRPRSGGLGLDLGLGLDPGLGLDLGLGLDPGLGIFSGSR